MTLLHPSGRRRGNICRDPLGDGAEGVCEPRSESAENGRLQSGGRPRQLDADEPIEDLSTGSLTKSHQERQDPRRRPNPLATHQDQA